MNEMLDGAPGPCQPIGCDNGLHLPGCYYADIDVALTDANAALIESLGDRMAPFWRRSRPDDGPRRLDGGESTSAELSRVTAELQSALSSLNWKTRRLEEAERELASLRAERDHARSQAAPRLPVTEAEVKDWYAGRGLAWGCGPGVLFAELRRWLGQDGEP